MQRLGAHWWAILASSRRNFAVCCCSHLPVSQNRYRSSVSLKNSYSLHSIQPSYLYIQFHRCEIYGKNLDKSVTTRNIRNQLPDVLPNDLPAYITHKIVKARIHILRTEFEWLLDDLRRCPIEKTEVHPQQIMRIQTENSLLLLSDSFHFVKLSRYSSHTQTNTPSAILSRGF